MLVKFIVAIDLGATNLKVAILNSSYRIICKKFYPTQTCRNKLQLIDKICAAIYEILNEKKINKNKILGIGIGVPGPIDYSKGKVHFFPNIPGWRDVGLKAILEKRIKLPVFIDNDANLMCLAETRIGAAKKSKNAICLTLGTGVGAGIIINRNLYRGSSFAAGEIGHMPLNERGPRCSCGGRACLERYIGNKEIKERARKVFRRDVSLEELSSLAKKGNRKAIQLWYNVGTQLGIALAGLANVLNPDCIVLGGGVAKAGSYLFSGVKDTIKSRAMPIQAKAVKLMKAKLGSDAGLIGAGILLKESLKLCRY